MVGPVAQAWDFAGHRRQPAGDEIAEGLPACVDVASVAVNEIHRRIEHVVDVTLEPEAPFEDEGQRAAAVGIGVGPDKAAVAEKAGGPFLDKRRVGEQGHGHRL